MIPARLSPHRFAAALAARLNAVVPPGLRVRAQGSAVSVYDSALCGGSSGADILAEEDGRATAKLAETAAWTIMDSTQDVVMESTREQWPMGATRAADAGARVVGDWLHLWFGDEENPVLRLESVDLTELSNGAA
jgi:hypothetical protein